MHWHSHLPRSCRGPFHPKTSSLCVSGLVVAIQMSLENMTASRTEKWNHCHYFKVSSEDNENIPLKKWLTCSPTSESLAMHQCPRGKGKHSWHSVNKEE